MPSARHSDLIKYTIGWNWVLFLTTWIPHANAWLSRPPPFDIGDIRDTSNISAPWVTRGRLSERLQTGWRDYDYRGCLQQPWVCLAINHSAPKPQQTSEWDREGNLVQSRWMTAAFQQKSEKLPGWLYQTDGRYSSRPFESGHPHSGEALGAEREILLKPIYWSLLFLNVCFTAHALLSFCTFSLKWERGTVDKR